MELTVISLPFGWLSRHDPGFRSDWSEVKYTVNRALYKDDPVRPSGHSSERFEHPVSARRAGRFVADTGEMRFVEHIMDRLPFPSRVRFHPRDESDHAGRVTTQHPRPGAVVMRPRLVRMLLAHPAVITEAVHDAPLWVTALDSSRLTVVSPNELNPPHSHGTM